MNSIDHLSAGFHISLRLITGEDAPEGAEKQTPEQIGQAVQRLLTSYLPAIKGNRLLLKTEYCNNLFEVEETVFELTPSADNGDFKQNYWIETN